MSRRALIFLIPLLGVAFQAIAQNQATKVLVNVDARGVALEGHDPVAFFSDGRPTKGDPSITAGHAGATYHFATAENRAAFEAEPERYVPAFGGYCAYGASKGYPAKVEIDTWQIFEGRLLLNYSKSVRKTFDTDRAAYLKKADANWPKIVEKEGKAPGI